MDSVMLARIQAIHTGNAPAVINGVFLEIDASGFAFTGTERTTGTFRSIDYRAEQGEF